MTTTEPVNFKTTMEAFALLAAQEGFEKAKTEHSVAKLQLANMERFYHELQRPWRSLGAVVEQAGDKWKCGFQGATAYGDTPEMACDNFDHLWMYGR